MRSQIIFLYEKLLFSLRKSAKIWRYSKDIYFPYIRFSTPIYVQNIWANPWKPNMSVLTFWNISEGNISNKFLENSSNVPKLYLGAMPSFTSFQGGLVHQIILKPSLSRIKLKQLYIAKFVQMAWNFAGVLNTPNEEILPKIRFVGINLPTFPFERTKLPIWGWLQVCTVKHVQWSSNLVEHPNFASKPIVLTLNTSGEG